MANSVINSLNYGGNTYVMTLPYGVCDTAADVAAKVVTVDNFSLEPGAVVIVKFSKANSAENPTLNVNNLGAKAIVKYGEIAVEKEAAGSWTAGAVQMFTYDGGYWVRDYWSDQNTDTKVTQNKRTTNGEFPLLLRGSSAGTANTTTSTSFGTKMTANPSTGAITATTFKGSVDGGLVTSLAFTPAEEALTPDQVHVLIGDGGRIKRGTWSYAGNGYITKDTTGFGAIDLAGTTVIQASNGDSVYTQIYITPPTSSGTADAIKGEMLYYINNGPTYSPSWYRVVTDKNYSKVISPHTLLNLLSLDTTTAFAGSDYVVAQTNGATEYKRRPLSKVWEYIKTETDSLYAPKAHASTATTYGIGVSDKYGHVKLSSSTSSTSGTSAGIAATPAAVKTTYDFAATKAPINHASVNTTYGLGDSTNYGHVKLYNSDDCTTYTSDSDGAVTPAAVKKAVSLFGDQYYLKLSGGTLTGPLVIEGTASSMPLQTRGIVGSDGNGTVGPLYLQYGANQVIHFGTGGGYTISADGGEYSGNAATATTASKANSAKRVENALKINNKTYDGSQAIDVGTIGTGYGGTGNTTFTSSTLIYASTAAKLSSLSASSISGSELTMSHSSTSRAGFKAKNSNGEVSLLASTNRGLYDETTKGWIIQMVKDGTAVRIPAWGAGDNKGSVNRPIYFNSNGEPALCTPYSGLLTGLSWTDKNLSITVGGTTLSGEIPDTITGFSSITSDNFKGVVRRVYDVETSRAVQGITWYKTDDSTLFQYIMGHNTGDEGNGALIINPHYESADAEGKKINTWTKNQGLYIGKTRLSYNGKIVVTAANFDYYAETAHVNSSNSANRVVNALKINGYTYDGSTAVDVGAIGAAYGGTGQKTLRDSANVLINALETGSSTPQDNDYYISQYVNGGTTTTTYHRRPMSALWSYIRGKAENVFAPKYHASESNTYGVGDATHYGHVLLYPAASCSTYTSDSGGAVTPAAVKKSFQYFGWALQTKGIKFSDSSITNLNTSIARGNHYANNASEAGALTNGPTTSSGFRLIEQEGYNDGTTSGYGRRFAFGSGWNFYYQLEKSTRGSWEPWRQLVHYLANTAIGDGTQLLKVDSDGGISLSNSTAGTSGRPVYLNNGVLTGITKLSTAYGGTGNNAYTKNRLVWTEETTKMTAGYHYANTTKIGVHCTTEPSYNFYVNGTTGLDGNVTATGDIIAKKAAASITTAIADGTNKVGIYSSTNRGFYDFTSSHWIIYKRVEDDTIRTPKHFYMDDKATITGNLTIKNTSSKPAAGMDVPLLKVSYQNTNGTYYTTDLISAIGTGETTAVNNACYRIGSTSGSLALTAGENGKTIINNLGLTNTENIYLIADAGIQTYVNCNTATAYVKGPSISNSGVAFYDGNGYQNAHTSYTNGTASTTEGSNGAQGYANLILGNSTAISSTLGQGAGNARGRLYLYGTGTHHTNIVASVSSSNKTVTIPNYTGNMVISTTSEQDPATAATYNIPFYLNNGSRIGYNESLRYKTVEGTAEANGEGYGRLYLGNATPTGTAGNKSGGILIYSSNASYQMLLTHPYASNGTTAASSRTTYLRDYGATAYLVATTTRNAVGSAALPVYVDASGKVTACTASSVFSAFSSSTNTLSITIAGHTRTASAVNSVSNTWANGTASAGPSLSTTVNGVTGTAVRIPMATNEVCGATKVWKAADCTSFTDDTYTLTCAAVKKAFGLFNAVSSSALIGGAKLTTTAAVDAFLTANTIKWANADKAAVSWNNDGMLISIGWSDSYGAQLWIDDGSGEGGMKLRNRGSTTTWNTWRSILTSLGGSLDAGKQLTRAGYSSSWYNGRDNAMLRQTTCSGYSPIISMKTTNGTWDIGSYNSSGWHDLLLFNYKSDTSYANGSSDNTVTHALKLSNTGYLTLLSGFSVGGNSVINNGILTFTHSTAANQKITTSAGEMHYASASTIYIDSGSGSSLIFRPQGTEQARFNTSGKLQIKSTGAADATIIGPGTAGTFYFPNTGGTFVTHETRGTAVGSASLPVYIASTGRATVCTGSSVFSALSWTAGTSSGPVLNATIAGYARTATIPSASASASGIVTTGAQTFAGNKTFSGTTTLTTVAASAVHKMPIYWQHSGSRYGEIVVRNNAGTTIGGIISDCGNATTFQKHQWTFRSYCAKSTNDTATSGYYEDYKFPESSDGRTSSISYTILTTKPSSLTYQVGRLIATATQDAAATAANNVALITGNPTGQHLEFDGNEIISKSNGTTGGILYLNSGGDYTQLYKTVFSTAVYGDKLPTSNLVEGQIYFKLI